MIQFEYDHNPEVQYRNRSAALAAGHSAWARLFAGKPPKTPPKIDPVSDAREQSEAGQIARGLKPKVFNEDLAKELGEGNDKVAIAAALVADDARRELSKSLIGMPVGPESVQKAQDILNRVLSEYQPRSPRFLCGFVNTTPSTTASRSRTAASATPRCA